MSTDSGHNVEYLRALGIALEALAKVLKSDALGPVTQKLRQDEDERAIALKNPRGYMKQHGIDIPDVVKVTIKEIPDLIIIIIFFCVDILWWTICVNDSGAIHVTPRR